MVVVYVDGRERLRMERTGGVPGQVRALLARMEADMAAGIELDGRHITTPDARQRGQFLLGELLAALDRGQVEFARTLLICLSQCWPDLSAVHADSAAGDWSVRLEFT